MDAIPAKKTAPRVALVEDDDILANLLRYNIQAAGFVVEWISNGSAAVAQLRDDPPDLVILDWMLPGLSGIEILRQLRAGAATRTLPVLMLTGKMEAADCRRAMDTGANVFITKPFSIRELMTRLIALLRDGQQTCAADASIATRS